MEEQEYYLTGILHRDDGHVVDVPWEVCDYYWITAFDDDRLYGSIFLFHMEDNPYAIIQAIVKYPSFLLLDYFYPNRVKRSVNQFLELPIINLASELNLHSIYVSPIADRQAVLLTRYYDYRPTDDMVKPVAFFGNLSNLALREVEHCIREF